MVGMSVAQYDAQFTLLSIYAPHMVTTEALRMTRFICGLANLMFTTLSSQFTKLTYAEAVNTAMRIEDRRMDKKVAREAIKKQKV